MGFSDGASTDVKFCDRRAEGGSEKEVVPKVELCATDGRTNHDHNHIPFGKTIKKYFVVLGQQMLYEGDDKVFIILDNSMDEFESVKWKLSPTLGLQVGKFDSI